MILTHLFSLLDLLFEVHSKTDSLFETHYKFNFIYLIVKLTLDLLNQLLYSKS